MVAWNSRSASSTLASPCSRQKAISGASRRMLIGFSTAPIIGAAKCASSIAGVLAARIATVSPRLTPALVSACASCRERA